MSNPYQQPPPDPYGSYGPPPQPAQPPYAAPQYQQPGYGYPQPVQPAPVPNNLAVASMVLGFLSVLVCFYGALLAPVGLGLGVAGLARAQRTGVGRTQAIGGLVLSVLGLLIGIAAVVLYETTAENHLP
ncbi:hypothetical protein [Kitasatospora sp. NPDC002040]|uniref:hypothetical protein n=1 Tax=Kitasatospora sp. NPDC002040 TaxID=3154661 RepID=UPI00331C62B2